MSINNFLEEFSCTMGCACSRKKSCAVASCAQPRNSFAGELSRKKSCVVARNLPENQKKSRNCLKISQKFSCILSKNNASSDIFRSDQRSDHHRSDHFSFCCVLQLHYL